MISIERKTRASFITAGTVARLLGVSTPSFHANVDDFPPPVTRIGGIRRWSLGQIQDFAAGKLRRVNGVWQYDTAAPGLPEFNERGAA